MRIFARVSEANNIHNQGLVLYGERIAPILEPFFCLASWIARGWRKLRR